MSITVKAGTLRRAAEAADGARGRSVYLLVGTDDYVLEEVAPTSPPADRIVIPCRTESYTVAGRPEILDILAFTRKNGINVTKSLALEYDAVFWDESSIEKFVHPYYAGLYGVDAPQRLQWLQEAWRTETVYAVAHLPKSDPYIIQHPLILESGATRIDGHFHVLTVGTEKQAYLPEEFVSEFLR